MSKSVLLCYFICTFIKDVYLLHGLSNNSLYFEICCKYDGKTSKHEKKIGGHRLGLGPRGLDKIDLFDSFTRLYAIPLLFSVM